MQILGGVTAILKKSCIWQLIMGGDGDSEPEWNVVQQDETFIITPPPDVPDSMSVTQGGNSFTFSGV